MTELQTRRIPNLLHFLLFLALTFCALIPAEFIVLAASHAHPLAAGLVNQRTQLFANALTYMLALAASCVLFPALWDTGFLSGIRWNIRGARLLLLIPAGLALGLASQLVSNLLPTPNKMPIEDAFRDPRTIWLLAAFGVFFAPLFEEIVFRGFLLPAIANVVDWVRLPRSADAQESVSTLEAWRAGSGWSPLALGTASVLTSLCFAGIHSIQLGFNWGPVALLVVVSLVLCYVRFRLDSVAASTLVHASYNLCVFITIFIATGGFRHLDRI